MEQYHTIKFYISRKMIQLSEDQIKRRLRHLNGRKDFSKIAKKIKTGRTYAWAINYDYLSLFDRQRALKKDMVKKKEIPVIETLDDKKLDYKYEISINLKGGINSSNTDTSYDVNYYKEVCHQLFKIVRNDMFYVLEKDKYGYHHVHIAINGETSLIKIALDHVLKKLLCLDDHFLTQSKAIHHEEIRNLYSFRKYLKKDFLLNDIMVIQQSPLYIYKSENYYE